MSTDYDAWRNDEEAVTWEAILEVFRNNVSRMLCLLKHAVELIAREN